MPVSARYRPTIRIVELGEGFYDVVAPARFPRHVLRHRNQRWAARVGLDGLDDAEWGAAFAAFRSLRAVVRRTARTVAAWMAAGFVHGVLNTDNMNVTGESCDYGPYRFLRGSTRTSWRHTSTTGLYRFGRQPAVAQWNLARLAEALALVTPVERLRPALDGFESEFPAALQGALLARLGLRSRGCDDDGALASAILAFLEATPVGVDRFFFDWYGGAASVPRALAGPSAAAYADGAFSRVRRHLETFDPIDPARVAHPYYQRREPCSLLLDEIETIWAAIAERDDWSAFDAKLAAIAELRSANPELVERGARA